MSERTIETEGDRERYERIRAAVADIDDDVAELQTLLEDCPNPALERNAEHLERITGVLEMNVPPRPTDRDS